MMGNMIIGRLLRYAGRKLDGYKTVIGGIGMILSGLLGLIGYAFPDLGVPKMELNDALMALAGGFAVLGIGGKVEKTKNELAGRG